MASYKAEFLSHYYETRRRPRQAMFMGRIGQWAPLASRFPWLTNFMTSTPPLARIGKWLAGVAQARTLPAFAPRPFRTMAKRRGVGLRKGASPVPRKAVSGVTAPKRVMLWVDTFNEHFSPDIAMAAVDVLSALGFDVTLPNKRLCCGRPLYDYGMLDEARALLRTAVDELAGEIEAGVPVIGLEPGCLSVFKDELLKQLPDEPLAKRLAAQTFLFYDFLAQVDFAWPRLDADVIVTATGLRVKLLVGAKMTVDGRTVDLSDTVSYKGMMYSDVPNLASSFGYTNASWTLKAELIARYVCRLLNHMRAHCYDTCVPRLGDGDLGSVPAVNLSSGYIQRAAGVLPKQGRHKPWLFHQNYVLDLASLKFGTLTDSAMRFERRARPDTTAAPIPQTALDTR